MKTPARIFQLLAGYSHHDAISNEARTLRERFRSWNIPSDIVCEDHRILPELRADALAPEDITPAPDDLHLLHFSTDAPIHQLFTDWPGRKLLLYHNITPPRYFAPVNRRIAGELARGRSQIGRFQFVERALAVSAYNAAELKAAGYTRVDVLPFFPDWNSLDISPDPARLAGWSDGRPTVLFVGRCAPHKRIEDLLFAFQYLRKMRPDARLLLAGSNAGTEKYFNWLAALVRKRNLEGIEWLGAASQPVLNAAYRSADLYLSMSEHEGFCVPLLEAMACKLPVIAYDAGAVAETLDGAGILFRQKKFDLIAEIMNRVLEDADLRRKLLDGQQARLERFNRATLEGRLRNIISDANAP